MAGSTWRYVTTPHIAFMNCRDLLRLLRGSGGSEAVGRLPSVGLVSGTPGAWLRFLLLVDLSVYM